MCVMCLGLKHTQTTFESLKECTYCSQFSKVLHCLLSHQANLSGGNPEMVSMLLTCCLYILSTRASWHVHQIIQGWWIMRTWTLVWSSHHWWGWGQSSVVFPELLEETNLTGRNTWGLMYKDFLLKHGVRSNQNALQRTKISGCINVCARMNPSTFLLYIPINVELSAHVPDSSLSTPLLKYANHI